MSSVSDIFLDGTHSITSSTAIKGKGANEMDMNDFMKLLVAQMTNQDMLNPSNDTEFIAQMAQFSTLQGMQTIQEYQLSSYAVSYTGKEVTIAHIDESTGKMETITGIVERVTFYDGKPQVYVNGKGYDLHTVMEVNTPGGSSGGGALSDASRYIGKWVSIGYVNDDGDLATVSGVVESASYRDGKVYVTIDGKAYPASGINFVEDPQAKQSSQTEEVDYESNSQKTITANFDYSDSGYEGTSGFGVSLGPSGISVNQPGASTQTQAEDNGTDEADGTNAAESTDEAAQGEG